MVRIIEWNGTEIAAGIERLTDIMIDCIEGGALVGHILPVDRDTIAAFWRDVAASTDAGERIVLIAEADGVEAGTVQLFLSPSRTPRTVPRSTNCSFTVTFDAAGSARRSC